MSLAASALESRKEFYGVYLASNCVCRFLTIPEQTIAASCFSLVGIKYAVKTLSVSSKISSKMGIVQEARREMFERSSRFGDVDRRTTWGATYKRMFRSIYPDESWQQIERRHLEPQSSSYDVERIASRSVTEYDTLRDRRFPSSVLQARPAYTYQSVTTRPSREVDSRSLKRVSIDESEARSTLSKRAYENGSSYLKEATDDVNVREYIQDVMSREFRDQRNLTVRQLNHHPEAVFNKTLKISGPEKTVYVHLRNRVRTSSEERGEEGGSRIEQSWTEPRAEVSTERVESYRQRFVNDSAAHTNASSWTGPHSNIPVVSSAGTSQRERRNSYCEVYDDGVLERDQETFDQITRLISRGEALHREELLILKDFHCPRVAEDEAELFYLLRQPREGDERRIRRLRQDLHERYTYYESLLEAARPVDTTSAILAHRILLADAYFFHARIEEDPSAQQRLYRRSVGAYSDLLNLAKRTLPSTDDSLLSILEKISQILRESHSQEPGLVMEMTTLLDRAEAELKSRPNGDLERKICRIRDNIEALGSYYYLYF
ncbi:unnamed protein product [Cylicocyclus nassatus]|uniref:Uncharacterized protein n=1 Tax=Cylicocyclus nassatus TaxID=53992 RepID=A0AA36M4A9_CYLNA|nr:unnamed protein product [Cylicocyclus nassatus]